MKPSLSLLWPDMLLHLGLLVFSMHCKLRVRERARHFTGITILRALFSMEGTGSKLAMLIGIILCLDLLWVWVSKDSPTT